MAATSVCCRRAPVQASTQRLCLQHIPAHPNTSSLHSTLQARVLDSRRALASPLAYQRPVVSAAAATETEAPPANAIQGAATLLRVAAEGRAVKLEDVFEAVKSLDKQRLKGGKEWAQLLGGDKSPGRRWKLVWTAGKDELAKDRKQEKKGKGKYFPLTAAQWFDAETRNLENGVYLGHIASFTFLGPYDFTKNKLAFNYWDLAIKLGPWTASFNIKKGDKDAPFDASDKGLPFFVFSYIDEHIAVAKGRGGGWAYWARSDPKWELEHGIV